MSLVGGKEKLGIALFEIYVHFLCNTSEERRGYIEILLSYQVVWIASVHCM